MSSLESTGNGAPAPARGTPIYEAPRPIARTMAGFERQNAAMFLKYTTVTPFKLFQGSFKCFYCEKAFPELHITLQHIKTHTVPSLTSLLNKFDKKGKNHLKVDASGLKCKICQVTYSNLDDVRKHLIIEHKKLFNEFGNGLMAYNLSTPSGKLACHKCGLEFTSFFYLNRHMNVHDNLVCEICGLGFVSQMRLKTHSLVHTTGHKCEKCKKVFSTKSILLLHTIKQHEQTNEKKLKRHKCPHCLEKFIEHYKKIAHMEEVHGITFKFECQTCKAEFPNKTGLTHHTRRVHTRNIVCNICGKCFATRGALETHMRGHTGKRNFVCAICQKAYLHEKQIRMHMMTIHGYKFTCFKCGNGFMDKAEVRKHQKQSHQA